MFETNAVKGGEGVFKFNPFDLVFSINVLLTEII